MMPAETFLVRTMSDTVERYSPCSRYRQRDTSPVRHRTLTFEQLRQIADGPSICFSFR
jgi:hypothetical protein